MDQLTAIKVFCRIVEAGGFTRGADVLDMPKVTASKLVGDLEVHLRIKLLKRTTRSVRVTSDGAACYECVSRWLRELDDIDSAFDSERVRPRGPRSMPALEFDVSDRTIQLIREDVDCVVRGGPLQDQAMVGRLLGRSRWMTAASPVPLRDGW